MQWTQELFFEPNLVILGLGASILAVVVIYNSYRKIQISKRVWVFLLLRVLLLVIAWQLLYHITALSIVGGGTIGAIRFKQSIVNTISFVITLILAYFIENRFLEKRESALLEKPSEPLDTEKAS